MPPARAPLLALVVLALAAPRAAAETSRPVDRVVRAEAVATPRASVAPASGLVAPLDALGLVADGTTPRSAATGAIGPTAYVEAVNRRVAVYDRSGRQLSTRSLEDFTGTGGPADAQVQWDPQGRRWLYLATATDPGADATSTSDDTHRIAFGYSRGPDPSDLGPGWCHYAFDTDAQLGGPGTRISRPLPASATMTRTSSSGPTPTARRGSVRRGSSSRTSPGRPP